MVSGQANAAEMLRLAVIETRARGVDICATVHDSLLVQAQVGKIEGAVRATREAMAVASQTILRGYELRVDVQVVRYPHRLGSEEGADLWRRIQRILRGMSPARLR